MSDWAKILVSALAGVTTGILLEPLRQWISMRNTASRVKQAIYKELGDLYHSHVLLKEGTTPQYHVTAFLLFKPDVFDYYYNTHREAFYRLQEWRYLIGMYEFLKGLKEGVQSGRVRPQELPDKISDEFAFRFSHGLVEKELVEKYARKIQRQHRAAMKLPAQ